MSLKRFNYTSVKILGFLFLLLPSAALASTEQVFRNVSSSVFQIKTASSPTEPKHSYGSGFVVSKDGLMVTNYHVIASSVQKKGRYRVFLVDGPLSIEAKLLAIDVVNDLALIQVDRKFPHALTISTSRLNQGERVFSIGLPEDLNMSIVEGTNNGVVHSGPYKKIFISSPINPGMSGGPTVNTRGEVVGVNVAILLGSQNISFAVPGSEIAQLLKAKRVTQEPADFDAVIGQQLKHVEDVLVKDFEREPEKANAKLVLDRWRLKAPSPILKCWSENLDHEKGRYTRRERQCGLEDGAFIDHGVASGKYDLRFSSINSQNLNPLQAFSLLDSIYNGYALQLSLSDFQSSDEYFTRWDCDETSIINSAKIPLKVSYCLSGYVKYPELYVANVKMATLRRGKDFLVIRANFWGFSMENILKFISTLTSRIEFE